MWLEYIQANPQIHTISMYIHTTHTTNRMLFVQGNELPIHYIVTKKTRSTPKCSEQKERHKKYKFEWSNVYLKLDAPSDSWHTVPRRKTGAPVRR